MDSKLACKILGIEEGSDLEVIKKAFKKKASELHPDVNKSPDANEKFKELNEAYQFLDVKKDNISYVEAIRREMNAFFYGVSDILDISITLEQAVSGGSYKFDYQRRVRCDCKGRYMNCKICSGSGMIMKNSAITFEIPPGTLDNTELTLLGVGDETTNGQSQDIRVFLHILPDDDMRIRGADIYSTINISLLEALEGTKRKVRTIQGFKTITIPSRSRNNDMIKANGMGINKLGNHMFVIHVHYPENVDSIINFMKKEKL